MNKPPMRRLRIYRSIPWLVFGVVLMPALATLVVGILIIALWDAPGDLALGILTLVFAVFVLTGAVLSLVLLRRQNRLLHAQDVFISNVSHELRTPLASIRMCADTLRLRRFSSTEEEDECLADLERETLRLSLLVEQLLGAGRSQRSTKRLDPAQAAERAMASFRRDPRANERLKTSIEPELPSLAADPDAVQEALSNMLDNAIKHAPDGPIVFAVRAEANGVAFVVRDSGAGIPKDQIDRLFERFERGHQANEEGIPGLGLGLSIVRACAESHGGWVRADAGPVRGLIVTMWLPLGTDG